MGKTKKYEFPGRIFIHSVKSEPHNSIILFPGQWGALARGSGSAGQSLVSQWPHSKNLLLIIATCCNLCKMPAQLQTAEVRQKGGEPESKWLLMREIFHTKDIQLLGSRNVFFCWLATTDLPQNALPPPLTSSFLQQDARWKCYL